jgi:hypothetical protein
VKIVEVIWIDIRSDSGWRTLNQLETFITSKNPVRQVGYLYEQDDDQIVLLDSYFQEKDLYGGVHTIPRGCIVSITEI